MELDAAFTQQCTQPLPLHYPTSCSSPSPKDSRPCRSRSLLCVCLLLPPHPGPLLVSRHCSPVPTTVSYVCPLRPTDFTSSVSSSNLSDLAFDKHPTKRSLLSPSTCHLSPTPFRPRFLSRLTCCHCYDVSISPGLGCRMQTMRTEILFL